MYVMKSERNKTSKKVVGFKLLKNDIQRWSYIVKMDKCCLIFKW